jgi:hypothetical protein
LELEKRVLFLSCWFRNEDEKKEKRRGRKRGLTPPKSELTSQA